MTEKIESFSSRKLAESNGTVMTTQNILREARMLKNVIKDPKQQQQSDVKEEEDLKEEKEMEEKEEQHRSFSRTGNDLIETDDELVEVSFRLSSLKLIQNTKNRKILTMTMSGGVRVAYHRYCHDQPHHNMMLVIVTVIVITVMDANIVIIIMPEKSMPSNTIDHSPPHGNISLFSKCDS